MKIIKLALLSWLVVLGTVALADPPSTRSIASQEAILAAVALPSFSLAVPSDGGNASIENLSAVVRMAPFRIEWGSYPRYSEVFAASLEPGLLEPCALVKVDVDAKRRWDFFLAPVALNNRAAGFAVSKVSW